MDDKNRFWSWFLGCAIVVTTTLLLVWGAYVSRVVGELREIAGVLKSEAVQLRNALAQSSYKELIASGADASCASAVEPSDAHQQFKKGIEGLASAVAQVQRTLNEVSAAQKCPDERAGLLPDHPPLAAHPPPKFGANPESLMRWLGEASPEKREQVDKVLRESAARARERIEAQSYDPKRPDFEVLSRVMQETQDEMAAELRDVMPQADFEALFPPELEQGVSTSSASPR